jgi:penicillin-binding protein 2A
MAMVGRVSQDSETVFRAYNFATSAKRSPGSAIKPLVVYTPAIESGESMNTMINDEPVDYNGWKPENADKQWHGEIPLYQALANSYNIPAIKTLEKVGINTAVAKGREFGLDLKTGAGLSLALGSGVETNPWQMAQAYSAFANNGVMIESHLIRKIVDATGKTIATAKPSESRVMDKKTADTMTSMMLGTFSNGTGVYANPYNGYTMAGKTGTNENVDQWVMGYTPNVVMSTWVGFENPTKEGHQLQGTSSGTASSIFKTAARYMLPGTENTPFDVENAYYTNGIAPSSDTTTDSSQTAADDALKNVQDKATDWWNDFKGTTKETVKEKGKGIWDTIKGWFQRTSFSFAK